MATGVFFAVTLDIAMVIRLTSFLAAIWGTFSTKKSILEELGYYLVCF